MKHLILYYFETCPYCQKVLRFMQANNIHLDLKDIHRDPKAREELRIVGGKTQVPCLVIDGSALYESDDIIKWLRENYSTAS